MISSLYYTVPPLKDGKIISPKLFSPWIQLDLKPVPTAGLFNSESQLLKFMGLTHLVRARAKTPSLPTPVSSPQRAPYSVQTPTSLVKLTRSEAHTDGAHTSWEMCASTHAGRAQECLATCDTQRHTAAQGEARPPSYSHICGEQVTVGEGQKRVFPRGQNDFHLPALWPVFSFQCDFRAESRAGGGGPSTQLCPAPSPEPRAAGGGGAGNPASLREKGNQSQQAPLWAWPTGLLPSNFICLL